MTDCKLATTPAIPGEVLPKTHQGEKHLETTLEQGTTFGTRDYILGQRDHVVKGSCVRELGGDWRDSARKGGLLSIGSVSPIDYGMITMMTMTMISTTATTATTTKKKKK